LPSITNWISKVATVSGLRRMQALVSQEAPFDHGRAQMKALAGLEMTSKLVERTAEAVSAQIAEGEQRAVRKAVRLDLPVIIGEPIHFPGAVQIVDLYHARQYLWDLARTVHPNDSVNQKAWMKLHQKRLLDKGKIEKPVVALHSIGSTSAESRQDSHGGGLF
jgi:hypothetical protein